MTVTSLSTLAAGLQRETTVRNNRVTETINTLVGRARRNDDAATAPDLSRAISLQNNVANLRSTAGNISQASSLLQVAAASTNELQGQLQQLADIAERAADSSISADARTQLTRDFASVREKIAAIVAASTFNGKPLLQGDGQTQESFLSALAAAGLPNVTLPDFSNEALFGKNPPTLQPSGIELTRRAIAQAQEKVAKGAEEIEAYRDTLSFANGALESAIQNQDAARSVLVDTDSNLPSQRQVGASSAASLLAQANRLPANILQLLSS